MSLFWRILIASHTISRLPQTEAGSLLPPYHHHLRRAEHVPVGDDTANARAAYAATSLLSMLLMATLFGSRAGLLFDRKWRSQLGFLRTLPLLLFFFGIAFNLSASLAVNGLDLTTKPACRGAMYICLVFYVGVKVCVQLFLIERAHVVRANSKRRLHDFFWLTGVFVVTVGFGTIAVFAFLGPVAEVDPLDGQCRIGLPRKSTMVLMAYDIFINLAMTAVFLALLRPMFRMRNPTSATAILTPMSSLKPLRPALAIRYPYSGISGGKSTSSSTTSSTEPLRPGPTTPQVAYPAAGNLEALVYKSLLGAILMMAATVINLALLFNYHGEEHSWLCFTCCLVDVTWSVAVIHFLTDAARSSDGNLRDSFVLPGHARDSTRLSRTPLRSSSLSW